MNRFHAPTFLNFFNFYDNFLCKLMFKLGSQLLILIQIRQPKSDLDSQHEVHEY